MKTAVELLEDYPINTRLEETNDFLKFLGLCLSIVGSKNEVKEDYSDRVDYVFISSNLLKSLKKLVKSHKQLEVEKLVEVINKLVHRESVKNYKPHPMQGHPNLPELHVTGDLLLLYEYIREDTLDLDLILHSVGSHDKLSKNIGNSKKHIYTKYDGSLDAEGLLSTLNEDSGLGEYYFYEDLGEYLYSVFKAEEG